MDSIGDTRNFTRKEMQKIMEDLTQYLKDIYRIWLKQKSEISVRPEKERLRVGVIQYKLLTEKETESDFFKRLRKAIIYLNNNPHIKITSDLIYSQPYEIEEVSPETIGSYIALKNNEVSTMLIPKKVITVDTYENRFVKGFLVKILKAINQLANDLRQYLLDDIEYEQEIEKMIDELTKRKSEIYTLLNLDFLQKISPEFEVRPTSVLKYNPIYNRIYKLYLEFNNFCIPSDSGLFNLQSFDEWRLFELWVFFEILKRCRKRFGEGFKVKNWFDEVNGRIKLKIGEFEEGTERALTIEWDNGYTLYYQRSFGFHNNEKGIGSYTVSIKPDIVLWNKENDELFIFDAKKQTIEELSRDSDRRTVIAQLHQYKDAIIEFETQRKVVKGVYAIIHRKPNLISPFDSEYNKFFEGWYRKRYGFGIYVFEILGEKEELDGI